MSVTYTVQKGFEPMRADITVDDTAFDGSNSGYRYTSWGTRKPYLIGPEVGSAVVLFQGEGADGNTFGCELWGSGPDNILHLICDVTGALGLAYADITQTDQTTRLFADDVTVSTDKWIKDVTTYDTGAATGRPAQVIFQTAGLSKIWPRAYNLAGAGQVARLQAMIRTF